MRIKYKLTDKLIEFINNLREKKMGYIHEQFGELLFPSTSEDASPRGSSSYYLTNRSRRSYVSLDLIRLLFTIEYNCELFIQKQEKMAELLNEAIDKGEIKNGTTLLSMYGTREKIEQKYNVSLICPPMEIFTEQFCPVDEKFILRYKSENRNLFAESLFEEKHQYLPIPCKNNILVELNDSQNKRLEEYISIRCEEIFKECNLQEQKSEYWLYALSLMYSEVNLTNVCYQQLKLYYFKGNEKLFSWQSIFKSLYDNKNLKRKKYYEDENVVYFRDLKENIITRDNLPVFYVKYKAIEKEDSSSGDKEVYNDYFEEEREIAVEGRIKLLHLFMMFFNAQLLKGKTEDEAFEQTCIILYNCNIPLLFNKTDIIANLPESNMNNSSAEFVSLFMALSKHFKEHPIPLTETELLQFWSNLSKYHSRFLNIISFDFTFVEKMTYNYDAELKLIIKQAMDEFKSKYNL